MFVYFCVKVALRGRPNNSLHPTPRLPRSPMPEDLFGVQQAAVSVPGISSSKDWVVQGLTNPRRWVGMAPRNFILAPSIFSSDFRMRLLLGRQAGLPPPPVFIYTPQHFCVL